MNEVFLDTETTGLSLKEDHRIVEIACLETNGLIPTKKIFHTLINPERKMSEDAEKIHGYSDKILKDKKKFQEIADDFLKFINGKKLIIHNAPFDISCINFELKKINKKPIELKSVIDSLEIARSKFPGAQNSLNNLCKRFNIDLSKRKKHNALLDCELLREVYINLTEQKEPSLIFNENHKLSGDLINQKDYGESYSKEIIFPTENEKIDHKNFLKKELRKNYF